MRTISTTIYAPSTARLRENLGPGVAGRRTLAAILDRLQRASGIDDGDDPLELSAG